MSDAAVPVIVGVDGSATSLQAARWAAAVATRFASPLHIVHGEPYLGHNLPDAAAAFRAAALAEQSERAEAILKAVEDDVLSDFPALQITTASVAESAEKALARASGRARLLVVGCDEVTPAGALLVGSTTLETVTHAACPVVAWRGEIDTPTAKPVVVGAGGIESEYALAAAFEFADSFNAPLRVVHSWPARLPAGDVTIPFLIDWDALEAEQRRGLATTLEPWQARYPGVHVELCVEQDKPSHALLQHISDAQLVVVGNRGRNAVKGAVLGSTGLNLLHHSPVPVMLCHRATQ